MTNPSLLSRTFLLAVLLQAPGAFGWNPRSSISSRGVRFGIGADALGRQRVSLSASGGNVDDDEILDEEPPRRKLDGSEQEPLYAEGNEIHQYMISRLEAMFDMDDDFYDADDDKSRLLLEGGERVVLGDWMDWEEGPCYGEACGEDLDEQCDIPAEFKVAEPKVDVMAFLGIRRAEPLQVQRDWD
jgi:hypothetical protein